MVKCGYIRSNVKTVETFGDKNEIINFSNPMFLQRPLVTKKEYFEKVHTELLHKMVLKELLYKKKLRDIVYSNVYTYGVLDWDCDSE